MKSVNRMSTVRLSKIDVVVLRVFMRQIKIVDTQELSYFLSFSI